MTPSAQIDERQADIRRMHDAKMHLETERLAVEKSLLQQLKDLNANLATLVTAIRYGVRVQ